MQRFLIYLKPITCLKWSTVGAGWEQGLEKHILFKFYPHKKIYGQIYGQIPPVLTFGY